jgi:ABC-type transport system involved in Fe-S cluster assembly fused permease/ATPase subunit
MNEADNKQRARGVDSLLNAETVKYFSMEAWEVDKYKEAVLDYQGLTYKIEQLFLMGSNPDVC